jgi:hypothetical protein
MKEVSNSIHGDTILGIFSDSTVYPDPIGNAPDAGFHPDAESCRQFDLEIIFTNMDQSM